MKIYFNFIWWFVARVASLRQADPHTWVCKSLLNICHIGWLENCLECLKHKMFDIFKRCWTFTCSIQPGASLPGNDVLIWCRYIILLITIILILILIISIPNIMLIIITMTWWTEILPIALSASANRDQAGINTFGWSFWCRQGLTGPRSKRKLGSKIVQRPLDNSTVSVRHVCSACLSQKPWISCCTTDAYPTTNVEFLHCALQRNFQWQWWGRRPWGFLAAPGRGGSPGRRWDGQVLGRAAIVRYWEANQYWVRWMDCQIKYYGVQNLGPAMPPKIKNGIFKMQPEIVFLRALGIRGLLHDMAILGHFLRHRAL